MLSGFFKCSGISVNPATSAISIIPNFLSISMRVAADGFYKIPGKIGPALYGMYIRKDWLDGQDVSPLTMNGLFFLRRSSVAFTGVNEWGKVDGQWTSEQMVPEYRESIGK